MPQKEDFPDTYGGASKTHVAVFDLQYFQITDHDGEKQEGTLSTVPLDKFVKKITSKHDCGYRGCFAGWYALLSQKDGLLTEDELLEDGLTRKEFGYDRLAKHFGISHNEARGLFASFGSGYEIIRLSELMGVTLEDFSSERANCTLRVLSVTHKQVMTVRIELLDRMLDNSTPSSLAKYWGEATS
jgi:hypothetical protein